MMGQGYRGHCCIFYHLMMLEFIPSGPTDALFAGTDVDGSNPYFKAWFYGKYV